MWGNLLEFLIGGENQTLLSSHEKKRKESYSQYSILDMKCLQKYMSTGLVDSRWALGE